MTVYDAEAWKFVELVRSAGIEVRLRYTAHEGYSISCTSRSRITDDMRREFRSNRAEIIKVLLREGDPSLQ